MTRIDWIFRRFRWCEARSPEGYRCIFKRGHDGLHVPHMGEGYAWGGDYSAPEYSHAHDGDAT